MIKKLIKIEKYSWVDSQTNYDSGITFRIETEYQGKRIWIFKFAKQGRTKITLMDLDKVISEETFPKSAWFINGGLYEEGDDIKYYLIGNLLINPEDYIYSKLYRHDRH